MKWRYKRFFDQVLCLSENTDSSLTVKAERGACAIHMLIDKTLN